MPKESQLPTNNRQPPSGQLINWVDGNPVPVYCPPRDNKQIGDAFRAALSLEYEPVTKLSPDGEETIDPKEEQYIGLTNLEVMAIRRAKEAATSGNIDASNFVLDRVVGKPKQTTEALIINTSWREAINAVGKQMLEDGEITLDVIPDNGSVLD